MEQKQLGRGCCCCRDFLLVSRETGGYYGGRSPKYRKIFKIFLENFFRYDIMKNYLYLKPKNPCHEGRAKTQQIKTLGGNRRWMK